ncbi:MAG TPA: inner membrane CreD family protein, partial [Roseomonas sp.]
GAEALWTEAYLATAASDPRPTAAAPALRWDGRDLVPETNSARCGNMEALRWPLRLDGPPEAGRRIEVAGQMALRGTTSLSFIPIAGRAHVTVAGDWQTPSYIGSDLPQQAPPQDRGFHAEWLLGRAGGTIPLTSPGCSYEISGTRSVGVALLEAVPTYRMVTRAAKYAMMFLVLTFLTYLLFELVAGLRIHIVQYGLLGLSVVMFPLLLLAIAEPAGFAAAYAASAALVMAQAGLYTVSVTRDRRLSLIFAGVLAALFGYLYVVLSMENFALLVGAATLFAALSAVMIVTRRLRWGG